MLKQYTTIRDSVTLCFVVRAHGGRGFSTPGQRALARSRLGTRLDTEGWLRLVESGSRSQLRNKEAVTERFAALLNQALRPPKVRKPTKVPKVQKLRRLASKKSRAEIKKLRERIRGDE